ncbi:MAG TPA: Si-specific NAD(P)(+) transhydrogenase [Isosphaeraceae bacterium]|nr:Si-specific NAD(P)(+) transhydrogenase [Isosphaeraceae bacterium]
MRRFDCAVIGTGPAGQKAAIQAAKLGKKTVVIERSGVLGGAAINTGTIPSKALREAVVHLTGASFRGLFGESYRVKRNITVADLIFVSEQVIRHELDLIRGHFDRNNIELVWGEAHFVSPNLLEVVRPEDAERLSADFFIIATGTRPARPESVPFNEHSVFCSDSLLRLERLPKSMIVVGGGVIGTEYACMMATLGVKVILVEGRRELLGFLDHEITEAFQYHMRRLGTTLRLGEKVAKIEQIPCNGTDGPLVQATLESGKTLRAQTLLYAIGRQGTTEALQLENVGLAPDDRGRLKVNAHYQTVVPHIYAVGDVIGFPALASTAMEQGRLAVCHAFGEPTCSIPELFPYGIYAIPEISMVGKTEDQLTEAGIPYEAGIAQYKELARGQLLGDETGMLKLLIHQETHQILGVHAIGSNATELIHIGQAVMAFNGTVDYFINNVFNFPTLAEAYKVAALNGLNKLRHI